MNAIQEVIHSARELVNEHRHAYPPTWAKDANKIIDEAAAELATMQDNLQGEEKRAEMHAELNRRSAEALGKPFAGKGSGWHDIPECIAALRDRVGELERERDAAVSDLQDAVDFVYKVYGESNETLAAITTGHWRAVIASAKGAK